jgi:hypothetical protein
MNQFEKALNQPEQNNGIARDPIIAALPVYAAIERLKMALMEDQDMHYAWQSKIALAFVETVNRYCEDRSLPNTDRDKAIVSEIANNAAIKFINSLCETSLKKG